MNMRKSLLAMAAAMLLALPAWGAETIKVGGLWDLTGVTADVGKPFAEGVQDAIAMINEKGGINGRKIELINVDYAYKIPQANATYKKFVDQDKVIMINGWGTGDTEALKDTVSKDKIPYFSASFSGHLTDPTKTPYNFFVGASYSDQIRGFLQHVKKEWKDKTRAPKVAFIYPNHGFGKAPIEAGRQYAKELGIEVVDEEIIPASFQDVTSNLLNMQKKAPDYAYVQTTVSWCAVLLKDAKKLGIKTKFFLGNYGMTEALPLLAKEAAEGVFGMTTHAPYGANVPGMKQIVNWNKKNPTKNPDTVYIRGWAYGLTWAEGLRIAEKNKQLTGEGVKKALETLKGFDTGGLVPPITYTAGDHRPTTRTTIYVIKGGKMTKVEDQETPRRKEWLGL
jgi:branched-chain amino acid transport system substrate-binding protein